MSVAIVVIETLMIPYIYQGPINQGGYGGEWGSPQVTVHVAVSEGLDPQCLMAVRDPETGEITLTQDPIKVQAKLDQAWKDLRTERNRRLAATDWTQLADAHLSQEKKDAWAAYRQELRDLPDETQDPTAPEWPLDPTQVAQVAPSGSRLSNLLGGV